MDTYPVANRTAHLELALTLTRATVRKWERMRLTMPKQEELQELSGALESSRNHVLAAMDQANVAPPTVAPFDTCDRYQHYIKCGPECGNSHTLSFVGIGFVHLVGPCPAPKRPGFGSRDYIDSCQPSVPSTTGMVYIVVIPTDENPVYDVYTNDEAAKIAVSYLTEMGGLRAFIVETTPKDSAAGGALTK